MKFAIYLDEISDDPGVAIKHLGEFNCSDVILRTAWGREITQCNDVGLRIVRDTMAEHNIKTLALMSNVGDVQTDKLDMEQIDRALHICSYLGAQFLRIKTGKILKSDSAAKKVDAWLSRVSTASLSVNIVPVIEPDSFHNVFDAAEIAMVLSSFRRMKLVYDPAAFVSAARVDPFVKYWSLLHQSVALIDLHDYKTGSGPRTVGSGDCRFDLTISHALTSKYQGWFCLEPGLGGRYNSVVGKLETFRLAYKSWQDLLKIIGMMSSHQRNQDVSQSK